jgi:hypothetical protein
MPQFDEMTKQATNEAIRPYIKSGELSKVAAAIEPYIQVRLYEESFADQLLPVRYVTEKEIIPELDNDSGYVIGKVEQPTAHAVVANFRDRPSERYIKGRRFRIPLGKHKTPVATKNKDELMFYDYDILGDAAQKDYNALGLLRDWKTLSVFRECTQISGKSEDIVDAAKTGPLQIDSPHINRLETLLNSGTRSGRPSMDQLKTTRVLMNDDTRREFALLQFNRVGGDLAGRLFTEGFMIERVLGIEYMSSIKKNLLTEFEPVTLVEFSGAQAASAGTLTVNGVAFTLPASTSQENSASVLAGLINSSASAAIRQEIQDGEDVEAYVVQHVYAVAEGNVLRIRAAAKPQFEDRIFAGDPLTVSLTGVTNGAVVGSGEDSFDVIWAFPDGNFMGELVRISGKDVYTEMWSTPGEEDINRVTREWFGLGIGNVNGAARLRVQRGRYNG